jgi:threonine/homoserine/homoserine lactone efflux protein
MIVFGIFTFFQKMPQKQKGQKLNTSSNGMSYLKFIGKGFLFNIANPGVWFYWVMPVGIAATIGEVALGGAILTQKQSSLMFLAVMLLTVLSCDILKCAIAYKLKTVLLPKVIHIINKVVGVILTAFGVYLAVSAFFEITPKFLN